jgi:hypothetical protein
VTHTAGRTLLLGSHFAMPRKDNPQPIWVGSAVRTHLRYEALLARSQVGGLCWAADERIL